LAQPKIVSGRAASGRVTQTADARISVIPTTVDLVGRVKTLKREDKLGHATLRAIREAKS
ncbi:hypothetical protein, partial [Mesorhizobium sp. M7A.F.Ca.CA.001.06.1.1]|uniref:hypothetical protein n=1 Tax=Mesorhizobium sp. M7A.F.Ca.CA.001.06.1.1 TaxID=2496682 RepID=UPI0019D2E9FB